MARHTRPVSTSRSSRPIPSKSTVDHRTLCSDRKLSGNPRSSPHVKVLTDQLHHEEAVVANGRRLCAAIVEAREAQLKEASLVFDTELALHEECFALQGRVANMERSCYASVLRGEEEERSAARISSYWTEANEEVHSLEALLRRVTNECGYRSQENIQLRSQIADLKHELFIMAESCKSSHWEVKKQQAQITALSNQLADAHEKEQSLDREIEARCIRPGGMKTIARITELSVSLLSDVKPVIIPTNGDTVTMHYVGTSMPSGKQFDSSLVGDPIEFLVGEGKVIRGWDEGLLQIPLGTVATLKVPASYAYGKEGKDGVVPPDVDLCFEIMLLKINQKSLKDLTENTVPRLHACVPNDAAYFKTLGGDVKAKPRPTELSVTLLSEIEPVLTPIVGDTVTIHYVGALMSSGKLFDSSLAEKPIEFVVGDGQVIQGWDEGLLQMHLGATATLEVPASYAYGIEGKAEAVPPDNDLRFEIVLLKINGKSLAQFRGRTPAPLHAWRPPDAP